MAVVAGSRSHAALVTGRNTCRVDSVTGRTGARQHTGVVIAATYESPGTTALQVARIASSCRAHMTGRFALGNGSVMAP